MSILSTHAFTPNQLPEYQDFDLTLISVGLKNLGYQKGAPGYKAIENPQTPIDKAFQIYALNLIHSNNYKQEPYDHEHMWKLRDNSWKMAALWLMDTQDILKTKTKKEERDLLKILPEALRCQCSIELPPGEWKNFPKDGTRKPLEIDKLMDKLQSIGLNWKIHGIAILEGSVPDPKKQLRTYGSLIEMQKLINVEKQNVLEF